MSEESLNLVLQNKNQDLLDRHGKSTHKIRETHTFRWNIFNHGAFDALLSETIDSTLGYRCKWYGYQYSEIIRSLLCVYFCGGSCVKDVSTHLMPHLSLHPTLRTCSADTILRAIRELSQNNISYTSESGKTYDFNTVQRANELLINSLLATGELKAGESYDLDFAFWAQEEQPHQGFCLQVHFCPSQMDKNVPTAHTEHIFSEQSLWRYFQKNRMSPNS